MHNFKTIWNIPSEISVLLISVGIIRTEWSTEKLQYITLTNQVRELSLMQQQEGNLSRPKHIEQKTHLTNAAHLKQKINISLKKHKFRKTNVLRMRPFIKLIRQKATFLF